MFEYEYNLRVRYSMFVSLITNNQHKEQGWGQGLF